MFRERPNRLDSSQKLLTAGELRELEAVRQVLLRNCRDL
jgi:hypothetical protein